MKISLSEVRSTLTRIYTSSSASKKDVELLVDMAVDHDLRGNTFSGLVHIDWDLDELKASLTKKEEVVVDKGSIKLIDGHGKSARLISPLMIELVVKMAQQNGIGLVGLYNSTYHSTMEYYARQIADHDLIGIISANGGPQGVTPFNGTKGVMGTNPLSYGIPSSDLPIVFDGATAQYAFGTIRKAKDRGQQLPEHAYFSKDGQFTTDPNEAVAIIPFGGHKGSAINILLEVLTGVFVRAKSGLLQHSEADLGSFFLAIDPAVFQPIEEFKAQINQLIKDIEAVQPIQGVSAVRVPGINSEKLKQQSLQEDQLEVDEVTWAKYQELVKKHQ